METIREILASHESGISRDGLLAWARLRGDPAMTDAQLDVALAELGDQVVDVQGFLYLRANAPESALRGDAGGTPPPVAPPAWPPSDAGAAPPPAPPPGSWTPPDGQAWGTPPPQPGAEGWGAPEGGWTPEPSSGGKRTMVFAAIGVAVFLGIAGVGAVLLRAADETSPADATPALPTPTSGSVVDAFTIEFGDCLIVPSEDQFEEIRRLECTEPHDGEVFFVEDYPGSDYPSDDAFSTYAEEQCLPAFTEFTGTAYDDQEVLDIGWFTPTPGSWGNGDREVVCYLTPLGGSQTSQSYRGANP